MWPVVADPLVAHADLEMFLTGWYRSALADLAPTHPVCASVDVTNREPSEGSFPAKLLVIRDDGGPDTSLLTGTRSVGLSVMAGTQENPQDAIELALIVHALRNQIPAVAPGNPVAAVLESNGPVPVPEAQPRSRRYITLTLSVVATAL